MMQQPGQGVVPPSMAPPPMDPQQQQPPPQQQPWMMMPPQPHPQQPLPQPVNPQASHMWNQQPQPQPQVQPQAQAQPMQVQYSMQPASADEVRTLWIGDLQYWMDEAYIHSCFAHTGEVLSVKIIRNKQTGQPEGYGFIEFASRATAERIIQTVNGTTMPNTEQSFRLNWATFGGGDKRSEGTDFPVFVGDLASDVTDYLLQETFRSHYSSVKGAKVVTDRLTGRSKGYGFVRFGDENEQLRAMTEMNGVFCSTRPMRIGPATTKKTVGVQQQYPAKAPYQSNPQASQSESDPNNTTIFVGGLDPNVNDDILKQVFGQYGELIHVKIPVGKRCGFVQFANRACAEEALLMLNGTQLGQQSIRLSWGRSPSNKQPQADPNQWNGGAYYGYNQGYETYGYAPPPQDPAMYAYGGYPGYGNYQQQQ
ncbi:polyadenylate-binding protein RBP45 isoform X2 [Amborella trichopoda]|uniref:polyadenylate-binding protein RBP45 isoform X2 n=1 Tax=Amborella trichopoda TaxID=13333 RepID=UPI0005D355E3|nr:polyadenylate-binding protein RBP45 isoform X2 [Amborella trichopoda]|eukprot:XP_011628461.1 polyadenylate-binding protein RBP45 isoform X2 [Amborella trichopoda]